MARRGSSSIWAHRPSSLHPCLPYGRNACENITAAVQLAEPLTSWSVYARLGPVCYFRVVKFIHYPCLLEPYKMNPSKKRKPYQPLPLRSPCLRFKTKAYNTNGRYKACPLTYCSHLPPPPPPTPGGKRRLINDRKVYN